MQQFEYKVVPAPDKGTKVKGLKTPAERYARALSDLMNQLSQDGWEYWRADTLPSEERKGLTGSVTVFHNLLVFRRPSAEVLAQAAQGRLPPPAPRPVLASALSAGDSWDVKAATAPPVASIAVPAAAAAAAAPLSPHAPEGRAPSLSAQRGWPEEAPTAPPVPSADAPADPDTQGWTYRPAPDAEADAENDTRNDTAPQDYAAEETGPQDLTNDPGAPAEGSDEVENLFYTDTDDNRARDTGADDDTPQDAASDPDDKTRP